MSEKNFRPNKTTVRTFSGKPVQKATILGIYNHRHPKLEALWKIRPYDLWSSRKSEIIGICMEKKKRFLLQFKNTKALSIKNAYLNSPVCLLVFSVVSGAIESVRIFCWQSVRN